MARKTNNKRVSTTDKGAHRVDNTNAPAVESENARYGQLGPFRHAATAASLTAVAMTVGATAAGSATSIVAGRNGAIVGITYASDAAITAGGASALAPQVAVGPAGAALAAQGTAYAIPSGGAQSGVLNQAGGASSAFGLDPGAVPFNEGDLLGVLLTANVDIWLTVRWGS
jgi:hypothetical protein